MALGAEMLVLGRPRRRPPTRRRASSRRPSTSGARGGALRPHGGGARRPGRFPRAAGRSICRAAPVDRARSRRSASGFVARHRHPRASASPWSSSAAAGARAERSDRPRRRPRARSPGIGDEVGAGRAARHRPCRATTASADAAAEARRAPPTASATRRRPPHPLMRASAPEDRLMPRAILLVLDSVGIGGAPDAAAFGDAGANTLGHIAAGLRGGRGRRDGRAPDRCGCRTWPRSASARRRSRHRRRAARLRAIDARRRLGLRRARSPAARTRRPAIGRSPACRCPSTGAISRSTVPTFPTALTDALIDAAPSCPASSATATPPAPTIIERLRRGAHPDRQADLLHLRRLACSRSPRTKTHFGLERLYEVCRIAAELVRSAATSAA